MKKEGRQGKQVEVVKTRIQQGKGKKRGNARGKKFEVLRKKAHNLVNL